MAMLKAKIQAELRQSGRNKQKHELKLIKYKWRHSRPRFCARPSPAGTNLVVEEKKTTRLDTRLWIGVRVCHLLLLFVK